MNCVYKIVCKDKSITEFYIGSTKNLYRRKILHKSDSNNLNSKKYCTPLYMFINVNGGFENWDFEIIKEYKFITKKELKVKEQYYKDLLKSPLNSINAKGYDIERKKTTRKNLSNKHDFINEICPYCNLELRKKNIKLHIKRKHSLDIEKKI